MYLLGLAPARLRVFDWRTFLAVMEQKVEVEIHLAAPADKALIREKHLDVRFRQQWVDQTKTDVVRDVLLQPPDYTTEDKP